MDLALSSSLAHQVTLFHPALCRSSVSPSSSRRASTNSASMMSRLFCDRDQVQCQSEEKSSQIGVERDIDLQKWPF